MIPARARALRPAGCSERGPLIRTRRSQPRIALVALAATIAVLAAVAPTASAAPAASATPTNRCWLDVVNDWLNHGGKIQNTYPVPCYTQAILHLNLYPAVPHYSNAPDDIQRRLLPAIRQAPGNGPGPGAGAPERAGARCV